MSKLQNRNYILFTFAVAFGWVLSLPYEGPVMYALAGQNGISGTLMNTMTVFCLFIGLFTGRFISTNLEEGKRTVVISIAGTLLLSSFIPFVEVHVWLLIMPTVAFLMGTVMAGYAHLIVAYVPIEDRSMFGADMLIYGNVVLVVAHALTSNTTSMISFIVIELLLVVAFILLIRIDLSKAPVAKVVDSSEKIPLIKYWMFFFFIFLISINSGIMFQVIYPYFSEFEVLTSLYTNLPYILAVYALSRLIKINKLNFLYLGLGLWGLTFVLFSFIGQTEWAFIIISTLMLSAAGIFDFFWWRMMTDNFETVKNPSSFFGLGLSLKILGVWVGGVTVNSLLTFGIEGQQLSYIGLIIVMISMMIILPLNQRLSEFLDSNEFMVKFKDGGTIIHESYIEHAKKLLSPREFEVFQHLIEGKTDTIICKELNISLSTTKTHNRKIYRKLGVSGRVEIMKQAQED